MYFSIPNKIVYVSQFLVPNIVVRNGHHFSGRFSSQNLVSFLYPQSNYLLLFSPSRFSSESNYFTSLSMMIFAAQFTLQCMAREVIRTSLHSLHYVWVVMSIFSQLIDFRAKMTDLIIFSIGLGKIWKIVKKNHCWNQEKTLLLK